MKKKLVLILLIILAKVSFAQQPDAARWTFSTEQNSNGEATLTFKLSLAKDWHTYSQFTPDGGPLPMLFKFDSGNCYQLIGKVTEPKPHEEYDSTFQMKVLILEKEVVFHQKIKATGNNCVIKGTIEYQICKDACIFKDTNFVFNVKKEKK
jgi:DsbC/DsbD-like thiol-disulfide interchange protein